MRVLRPASRAADKPDETGGRPARPSQAFDFARLLRRARLPGPLPPGDQEDPLAAPSPAVVVPPLPAPAQHLPAQPHTDWFLQHSARNDPVQSLACDQAQATALCSAIAGHVAGFCADPAVASRGDWMLRVTLDPVLLPGCVLQMDLSFLRLALRFETREADTRALVLRHVDTLEANLTALLRQHAMVHDLEITVW
ncbi:HpaP protein; Type III secretion protein (YscP) [plant metagenome]|uniref:HpaP protein Type III secretion protein (YscP) n=1 Tax=plant metagenome TaxID=1297885 RepID=A0A484STU5_9ZZZZ